MSEGERSTYHWSRRILLTVFLLLTGTVVLYLAGWGCLRLWNSILPSDAPKIAMTPDDGWLSRLGFTSLTYDQIFSRAGGRLIKLEVPENTADLEPGEVGKMLAGTDALLLTGGGDVDPELYGGDPDTARSVNRKRDEFEVALIREARRRQMPILGICRGCQILNVAFGGELVDLDLSEELKKTHFAITGHPVKVQEGSLLAKIMRPGKIENVESYHHQAVGRLGDGVRAVAHAPDGTIEAIEISGNQGEWIVAVQWHPEMTVTDQMQFSLIRTFVEQAGRSRQAKKPAIAAGKPE